MMDLWMLAVIAICFTSMKLFADWCEGQIGSKKK